MFEPVYYGVHLVWSQHMHLLKRLKALAAVPIIFSVYVTAFNVAGMITTGQAHAQSKSHGVVLNRGSYSRGAKLDRRGPATRVQRRGKVDPLIRSVNNPLFVKREVFDAVKGARSGVRLKGFRGNNRNDNIRLIQREIQIQRQNEETFRRNQQRRLQGAIRRTQPNGRFLTRQEKLDLLNNNQVFEDQVLTNQEVGGVSDRIFASDCPSKHNCGYRIYENGTGPRIIRPSTGFGNDLPNYDGLNGPKVITLD